MSDIIELLITSGVLYSIYQSFMSKKQKKKKKQDSLNEEPTPQLSSTNAEESEFAQSIESLFGISVNAPTEESRISENSTSQQETQTTLGLDEELPTVSTFDTFPIENEYTLDEQEFKSALPEQTDLEELPILNPSGPEWVLPSKSTLAPAYLDLLMNPSSLKDAVIMQEILEKPVAMRRRRF